MPIERLAGNKDVALQRVLCSYHQLVAGSISVSEPAALVAFPDAATTRPRTTDDGDEDFCRSFDGGEEHLAQGVANNVCRHDIDLIRDSVTDFASAAAARSRCSDRQRQSVAGSSYCSGQPTVSATTTTAATVSSVSDTTLGRVSFTSDQRDETRSSNYREQPVLTE